MSKFTHLDSDGNAIMVDVSEKPQTERMAIAKGEVLIAAKTMKMIIAEEVKKGDVLNKFWPYNDAAVPSRHRLQHGEFCKCVE